jgi:peptidoglycan/LPS O-acetylase OafA/YrhL
LRNVPAATTEREFRHVPGLDGVRGVAVVLVVLFHYGKLWRVDTGGLLPAGYVGVDIFFVLSGFLITSLLLNERAANDRVSLPRFYIRRGLRLLPALVTVLAAHLVYAQVKHVKLDEELKQIASVLAYVSNFAQTYWLPRMLASGLSFTWSLAIEEQFYLLWPAVLLFGVLRFAKTRPQILTVVFGLALLSALIRVYLWKFGSGYPAAYMRPDARADGLLIGAGCAFLWRWRWVPTKWVNEVAVIAFVGIIGTALVIPSQSTVMFWGGFTVVSVAAAVVVLATADNLWAFLPLMEAPWLRLLGKVSYGLYLWHALSLRIAFSLFQGKGPLFIASVGLVFTAISTTASWFLVEQPFLRLKARFGRPVAVPAPAPAGTVTPGGERPLRARNR